MKLPHDPLEKELRERGQDMPHIPRYAGQRGVLLTDVVKARKDGQHEVPRSKDDDEN
jgi:hypothetical protein